MSVVCGKCGIPNCPFCAKKQLHTKKWARNWAEMIRAAGDPIGSSMHDSTPTKSKLWSGTVTASYVGLVTVDTVTRYAVDVLAQDEETALTIVKNLYRNILQRDYPRLDKVMVIAVRMATTSDKDKRPHFAEHGKPGPSGFEVEWSFLP